MNEKKKADLQELIKLQVEVGTATLNLLTAKYGFINAYARFKNGTIVLHEGKKYQVINANVLDNPTDVVYRLHAFTKDQKRPKHTDWHRDIYVEDSKLELYADPKTSSQTSSGRSETVEH